MDRGAGGTECAVGFQTAVGIISHGYRAGGEGINANLTEYGRGRLVSWESGTCA